MCRNIIPYYSHLSTVSIPYTYRYGFCAKQGEERAVSFAIPRYSGKRQEREQQLNQSVTSAEYWFYDGRLGRRWNVDPVVKPWRSPYDGFRNCPLVFIDPKGDDDYFDNSGKYLGTDGTNSNLIRVTTKDVYLQITETILANSNSKDGQIKKLNANSKLLANFQFNISSNNYMLMMIMAHYYANVLGYTEKKVIGGTLNCSEDIIAICDEGNINSNNLYFDEEIYLGMINGKINPNMSNKYDLMNTLVHKRTHLPDHGVQAGAEYPIHFEAYIAQFEHWTWEKTTDEFKQTQISNASENLAIFKYSKPEIYNSYKARIEKALGIVYDELDYEWKEDGKGDKELVYNIKYHEVK